ncbi:hypothetical protein JTB14_036701 [Gonioctena quinquepunctata]|nr:hypothetical protein JTB14_036701 [Gonioctena quinquepunctata]
MAQPPWKESVLKNTKIEIGNPLYMEENTVEVVMVEPEDKDMHNSIQRLHKERYPVLANLKGELEMIKQTTRIRGQPIQDNRKIIENPARWHPAKSL